MLPSTQYFVVSIDEEDTQGVYCAYCGTKIVPAKDEYGAFIFRCACEDANREHDLYAQREAAETDLENFLNEKQKRMQINEIKTRIVVYEQHVHEMKKKLQGLLNALAGVPPSKESKVSELHVPLNTFSTVDPHALIDLSSINKETDILQELPPFNMDGFLPEEEPYFLSFSSFNETEDQVSIALPEDEPDLDELLKIEEM